MRPRGVENRNWYVNSTGKQPKMADETLLSPRKKASHHHAAEPSRPSRHRGRLLPMLQKPLLHCAYNSAKLGVEGRGGEEGRELESHSLIRNFVPSWLVGALNFLCMNYDVRNSWLVSHQNEASISAQGPEIQMPLARYPLSKVAHLDVTSRLAGQRC